MTLQQSGRVPGRRLTRVEFRELMADRASEVEAREAGLAVPPGTARRRPVPVPPILLTHKLPTPSRSPVAANDNPRPEPIKPATESTPDRIPNALRKASPQLHRTLCRLRELARPAEMSAPDIRLAANDNRQAADDTGVGLDMRHVVTPGDGREEELVDAFADGMRSRVVTDRKGRIDRFQGGVKYHKSVRGSGEIVEIGGRSSRGRFFGMRFHRGALVHYCKAGKRVVPSYEQGDPRGSDDAELPRVTTAAIAAHPALAEIDRADAWADFTKRIPFETARLLAVLLDADNFQEVARAAKMTPTAHNGRRITEKILAKAEKLLAA